MTAVFAARVSELPRLLDALQYHPNGLTVDQLAAEVARTPDQVMEALLTYYSTDFADYAPDLVGRPPAIEFVTGATDDDPGHAHVVRLVAPNPGRELGVAYLSVAELARLYRAGTERLEMEPGNEVLGSAVEKLRAGLLPGVTPSPGPPPEPAPADFEIARRDRHKIKISYARAWHPGVAERLIEPYRLIRTRRGWELDAGPPDTYNLIRTYLLDRIITYQMLEETFTPPSGLADLLHRQRSTTPVELAIPHEARWSVERYAERTDVLDEDETQARLRAHLLQPVRQRVGLILLDGGPAAKVIQPTNLVDSGRELARTLLAHYEHAAET
ncbi:MAG TPA: WYL domain-containing protein [Microlunatus sp.]|nr:WYL domain-containing protein [Microlunatus sp.]